MTELASFTVTGRPRTKGSLKVITPRGRKPILIEDHALSKPWRTRIVAAIRVQCPHVNAGTHVAYAGAVTVSADFHFTPEGPSAGLLPWPVLNAGVNANGDLDKLLRNLLDALKDAKVIKDDCLVVGVQTSKRWVSPGVDPGVHVMVRAA